MGEPKAFALRLGERTLALVKPHVIKAGDFKVALPYYNWLFLIKSKMKNLAIAPWANSPYQLSFKEIQDPFLFLEAFFKNNPDKHRRDLKLLMNAAYSPKAYKNKERGTTILFPIYLQCLRLLECCSLLWVKHYSSWSPFERWLKMREALKYGAKQDWLWFPDDLSKKELRNPYFAIRKIFNKISMFELRCDLEVWVTYAYSNDLIQPDELIFEPPILYDTICKLYSAAWAVWQVDGWNTYFKESAKAKDNTEDSEQRQHNE